jgi:hypothetical protein
MEGRSWPELELHGRPWGARWRGKGGGGEGQGAWATGSGEEGGAIRGELHQDGGSVPAVRPGALSLLFVRKKRRRRERKGKEEKEGQKKGEKENQNFSKNSEE